MTTLLTGDALLEKAQRLGISTEGDPITQSRSGRHKVDEATLQARVIVAETYIREKRLLWIAIISAVIALVSAVGSIISGACAYYALHHENHERQLIQAKENN